MKQHKNWRPAFRDARTYSDVTRNNNDIRVQTSEELQDISVGRKRNAHQRRLMEG